MPHAHDDVVPNTLEHLAQGVFMREDLDAEDGRGADNLFAAMFRASDREVGDAKVACRHLHARLEGRPDLPLVALREEAAVENALQGAVIHFAHIALLNETIEVVDIGPEGCAQLHLDREWVGFGGGCQGVFLAFSLRSRAFGRELLS